MRKSQGEHAKFAADHFRISFDEDEEELEIPGKVVSAESNNGTNHFSVHSDVTPKENGISKLAIDDTQHTTTYDLPKEFFGSGTSNDCELTTTMKIEQRKDLKSVSVEKEENFCENGRYVRNGMERDVSSSDNLSSVKDRFIVESIKEETETKNEGCKKQIVQSLSLEVIEEVSEISKNECRSSSKVIAAVFLKRKSKSLDADEDKNLSILENGSISFTTSIDSKLSQISKENVTSDLSRTNFSNSAVSKNSSDNIADETSIATSADNLTTAIQCESSVTNSTCLPANSSSTDSNPFVISVSSSSTVPKNSLVENSSKYQTEFTITNVSKYTDNKNYHKFNTASSFIPTLSKLTEMSTSQGSNEHEIPISEPKEEEREEQKLQLPKTGSRRLTLPMTTAELNLSSLRDNSGAPSTSNESSAETPTFEDVLSGTSVNPIRRSSIANAAICSSLAPSLISAFPGVPSTLLPARKIENSNLRRSATLSNISSTSTNISDDSSGKVSRKLKLPFLRLHIPEQPNTSWNGFDDWRHHHHHHHHHHVFPHIHVPTFTFTAPATDGSGRKFNFGIRRHSQTVSPSES